MKTNFSISIDSWEKEIINFTSKMGDITYLELLSFLGEKSKDTKSIWSNEYDNILFYNGLSEKLVNIIIKLVNEEKLFMQPTSWVTYLTFAGPITIPNIPIAKSQRNYKKPHWIPVVFRTIRYTG